MAFWRSESKQAVQEYQAARNDLEQIASQVTDETPEWNAANNRVAQTEQKVSWFRRGW